MAELEREFSKILAGKNALIALYTDGGEPEAFAQCQLRTDYVEGTESSPVGYLDGLYVREHLRRKGIAALLLRYCEGWAMERGYREFASDCEADNTKSFDFHIAAGFTEVNRIICFKKNL